MASGRSHEQVEACQSFTTGGTAQEVTVLLSTAKMRVREEPLVLVAIQDISARKKVEELVQELNAALKQRNAELDAERARWQSVVESMAEEIWACDAQGKMSLMNLRSVTPMGLEEFKDKSLEEILNEMETLYPDGQPRPPEQSPLMRSLRGEVLRGEEIMRHRRTGRMYYRRFSSAPTRDATGAITGAVAIVRDITEYRQAQQALIRSEKLAATGRLAASIAHEINNPLEMVGNAVYLAASDSSLSDAARAHLALAERELERAAHLTRQTLGFYRETKSPSVFQLSTTANAVLELYRPKLTNRGIVVSREFAEEDRVVAVEGEVRQILSNLLANAIDAVPQGGRISVRTSHLTALNSRRTVRFTIADNGTGIEPALRKKVFEPFFTTKESLGTGLGLWVTKELALKQKANIRLRSQVGEGTVFCCYFPAERRAGERTPLPAETLELTG
jgi:PAS domain S-box-containing protein